MTQIEVRPLSSLDAKAMAAIHAESFAPPFGSGGWDALEMAAHIYKDQCWGVDRGGHLAAFVILSVVADQAEILTIATAPAARRHGLGRDLLAGIITSLENQGVRDLFLEVAEDNEPAIKLYRAAGFLPIGRRPAYYRREQGLVAALTFSKNI